MNEKPDPDKPMTLREAAEFAKVSQQTIRRKKDLLTNVGAITSPQGWQVSINQLAAVRLLDNVTPVTPQSNPVEAPHNTDTELNLLREYVETLKTQLKREQERADQAENRANQAEERLHRLIEPPQATEPGLKQSWLTKLFRKH